MNRECPNHDSVKIKKILKMNPGNLFNPMKIMVQTKDAHFFYKHLISVISCLFSCPNKFSRSFFSYSATI
jgi:hypothetical protein